MTMLPIDVHFCLNQSCVALKTRRLSISWGRHRKPLVNTAKWRIQSIWWKKFNFQIFWPLQLWPSLSDCYQSSKERSWLSRRMLRIALTSWKTFMSLTKGSRSQWLITSLNLLDKTMAWQGWTKCSLRVFTPTIGLSWITHQSFTVSPPKLRKDSRPKNLKIER